MSDTPLQDAILDFIEVWKADPVNDGNSPTYQDIADALGKYRADIHSTVQRMAMLGKLKLNPRGKIVIDGIYLLRKQISE